MPSTIIARVRRGKSGGEIFLNMRVLLLYIFYCLINELSLYIEFPLELMKVKVYGIRLHTLGCSSTCCEVYTGKTEHVANI